MHYFGLCTTSKQNYMGGGARGGGRRGEGGGGGGKGGGLFRIPFPTAASFRPRFNTDD